MPPIHPHRQGSRLRQSTVVLAVLAAATLTTALPAHAAPTPLGDTTCTYDLINAGSLQYQIRCEHGLPTGKTINTNLSPFTETVNSISIRVIGTVAGTITTSSTNHTIFIAADNGANGEDGEDGCTFICGEEDLNGSPGGNGNAGHPAISATGTISLGTGTNSLTANGGKGGTGGTGGTGTSELIGEETEYGDGGRGGPGGTGGTGNAGKIIHKGGNDTIRVTAGNGGDSGQGGLGATGIHAGEGGIGDAGTGNTGTIAPDPALTTLPTTASTDIELTAGSGSDVGAANGTAGTVTAVSPAQPTQSDQQCPSTTAGPTTPARICLHGPNSGNLTGPNRGIGQTVINTIGNNTTAIEATGVATAATGTANGTLTVNGINRGTARGATGTGNGEVTINSINFGTATGAANGTGTVHATSNLGTITGSARGSSNVTVELANKQNAQITGVTDGNPGSTTTITVGADNLDNANDGTITGITSAATDNTATITLTGGPGGAGNGPTGSVTGTTDRGKATITSTGGDGRNSADSNHVFPARPGGPGNAGIIRGTTGCQPVLVPQQNQITATGGTGGTNAGNGIPSEPGGAGNTGTITAGGPCVRSTITVSGGTSGASGLGNGLGNGIDGAPGNSATGRITGSAITAGPLNLLFAGDTIVVNGGKASDGHLATGATTVFKGGNGGTANAGTITTNAARDTIRLNGGAPGKGGNGLSNGGNGGRGGHANSGTVTTNDGADSITLTGANGGQGGGAQTPGIQGGGGDANTTGGNVNAGPDLFDTVTLQPGTGNPNGTANKGTVTN
ncbi:beta strand repeat-containing protein [Streptomyces vinaceus]